MNDQMHLPFSESVRNYQKEDLIENIKRLISMHKNGMLGGEVMPEDARPHQIDVDSNDNFHFLTLPMALNYQRNSYTLWESAAKAYNDEECIDVFCPKKVVNMGTTVLREKLLKHKVALQPNKHIDTWQRISDALVELADGQVKILIKENNQDVNLIREFMQFTHKKRFPYISGEKIFNYWLYVLSDYTNITLKNRDKISIAPDTHVLQSSIKLGITNKSLEEISGKRAEIAKLWKSILSKENIAPIDIHTPLWLWSKAGFPQITDKKRK